MATPRETVFIISPFQKISMSHAVFNVFNPYENFKRNTFWMGNLQSFHRKFTAQGLATLFSENIKSSYGRLKMFKFMKENNSNWGQKCGQYSLRGLCLELFFNFPHKVILLINKNPSKIVKRPTVQHASNWWRQWGRNLPWHWQGIKLVAYVFKVYM